MTTLLYVPTTPPQRGPFELTCRREAEGWTVRPPGLWTARGEVFEADPPFVDAWLREALTPFGGDAQNHLTEAQFQAFIASLEPVLRVGGVVDLDRLIAAFPADPMLLIERAKFPGRAHDLEAALALREDAQTLLAASYAQSGQAAIAFARRALEHEPSNHEAATHLMMLLQLAGQLEESLAVEEKRAIRDWRVRGGLLVRLGRLELAVDAFAQSLALKDEALLRAERGTLLAKLGRDDEALRELDAALPRCTSFEGTLAKADILIRRGEVEAARPLLRWLALAPSHREVAEERLRASG